MSDPRLTAFLTKQLCANGGRLTRAQLIQYIDLPQKQIDQTLQEKAERFPQVGELVLFRSPIRICPEYIKGQDKEDDCSKLHLCGFYLRGKCRNRSACKYSHNTRSEHNLAVLRANEVSGLNDVELKIMLFQNDHSLLPWACHAYQRNNCDQVDCKWLHICSFFIRGECNNPVCKKSHNLLEERHILLLKPYPNVSMENFQMLSVLKHNENLEKQRASVGRSNVQNDTGLTRKEVTDFVEICLFNIWNVCKFQSKCSNMHHYLPYRWQTSSGTEWKDLSDMENIERAYSDPKINRYSDVDFQTMKSGFQSVRRLCTPSSVLKPDEFVLTTEWLWYWSDQQGVWNQYGKSNTMHVSASITSADLEKFYLSNPNSTMPFNAGEQQYEIDFKLMTQRNIVYKTERKVRRRPKFLSHGDVIQLKGSAKASKNDNSLVTKVEYPCTWDTLTMPDIGYKLVDVPLTSLEASLIQAMFTNTISGCVVKKIIRIQNISLWQAFHMEREKIKRANEELNATQIEKQLFHGTSSDNLTHIFNRNIDWRICGTNGVQYGQGSYFARDASYSHNYSLKDTNGLRSLLVARVLVGEYITGNHTYRRPPLKPGSTTHCYDSCVDNMNQPSIFVVFEKHQIYPEYLIEYEEQKRSCCIS